MNDFALKQLLNTTAARCSPSHQQCNTDDWICLPKDQIPQPEILATIPHNAAGALAHTLEALAAKIKELECMSTSAPESDEAIDKSDDALIDHLLYLQITLIDMNCSLHMH